jgi:predicted RNA binding protein YcfA (HicA-like mRNA interferase family)
MIRLGGLEVPGRGKGSHRSVLMPNGFTAVFPSGTLKTGLLADQLKESRVTIQEFIDAL